MREVLGALDRNGSGPTQMVHAPQRHGLPRAGRRAGCSEWGASEYHGDGPPPLPLVAGAHSVRAGGPVLSARASHRARACRGAFPALGHNGAGTSQRPARATAAYLPASGALKDGNDPLSLPVMGARAPGLERDLVEDAGVRRSVDRRGRVVRWLPARISHRASASRMTSALACARASQRKQTGTKSLCFVPAIVGRWGIVGGHDERSSWTWTWNSGGNRPES